MTEKTCIACAETIKEAAKLCRFCGTRQDTAAEVSDRQPSTVENELESQPTAHPSRRQPLIIAAIVAGVLVATSAVGAIAWQATSNNVTEQATEEPVVPQTESTERPAQPLPPPRPQQPEPEPEPPPPPPKSPEEILAEQHAAEMKRVCEIVVFYDWDRMDASWGNGGHWKDVFRAYDELDSQIGRVVSFFDFSMQYDRTMDTLLRYGQMAQMWEEIDVFTSWEVATPANRFYDDLNVLWRMCGY